MSTTTSPALAIRDFAAAVRAALSDLPSEDVEELTDGLEADLTEQAEDLDAEGFDPGDAVGYADELRAAAGLPVRGKPRLPSAWTANKLRAWASAQRSNLARKARSTVIGSHTLDFFISLRPFWWVLRGWAVYKVITALVIGNSIASTLPSNGGEWVLLLLFVTVSVQWGRGRWLPWSWLPPLRTLVSVCSIIALPLLLVLATPWSSSADQYLEDYVPQGLLLDGNEVSNVFAYDSDGQPLTGVQLFDQDGKPLTTVGDPNATPWVTTYGDDGTEVILVPSSDVPGRTGWNVFPLNTVDSVDNNSQPSGEPDLSTATPAVPPFTQVRPLTQQTPTPTAPPTPAPSAAPPVALEPSATPTPNSGGDN
jgi:hypothetical protein